MKIRVAKRNGYCFEEIQNLVYLKAKGSYTELYMKDGSMHFSSNYLGKIGDALKDHPFLRISRFEIVNFSLINEVNVVDCFCILRNGDKNIKLSLSPVGLENLRKEKIL